MRIAHRLVALTAGTLSIVAVLAGVALVWQEREQILADERMETRIFAGALRVATENALRDGQELDVRELLGRLQGVASQVEVAVYRLDEPVPVVVTDGAPLDTVDIARLRSAVRTGEPVVEVRAVEGGLMQLVHAVPLRSDDGEPLGSLIVMRPLIEMAADLRITAWSLLGWVLLFALSTAVLLGVGLHVQVAGPLTRLGQAAERLAQDIHAPLHLPQEASIELAQLSASLTSLQRRLQDAQARQREAAREREELERSLIQADKLVVFGQLAAGVAHEIGSPLQVLASRASLLARAAPNPVEVQRQAGLIEEQVHRLARIVARLQETSRHKPSPRQRVDLREPVHKVHWLLEPSVARKGIGLELRMAEVPCVVLAHPDEVQQVVLNLVMNALQASTDGSVIRLDVSRTDDAILLSVIDQGRGMDEATRARMFEPFFTMRSDTGGTGLGLSVVRSILDRHGATVEVQSAPGAGTHVTVYWKETS